MRPQVVGSTCVACRSRIAVDLGVERCGDCAAVFHASCQRSPDLCPGCGTSLAAAATRALARQRLTDEAERSAAEQSFNRRQALRAVGFIALGVLCLAAGVATLRADAPLWKAFVLLGVVLVMRGGWDLFSVDAWLGSAVVAGLVFAAMGIAAWSNVSAAVEGALGSLRWRAWSFSALGAAGLMFALLRGRQLFGRRSPAE